VLKFFRRSLLLLPLCLNSPAAYGWGSSSHKIIAQIAADHISPDTAKQIALITSNENLQQSAWWPDQIKSTPEWSHTRGYHFNDMNDGPTYLEYIKTLSDYYKKKGDIVRAVLKAEDVLRSPTESKDNKKYALRFLVHLVGDIHQPLHSGFSTDIGGNKIAMDWFGIKTNLHSVWDGSLTSAYAYRNSLPKPLDARDYISTLRTPSSLEIKAWQGSYVLDWLNESLDVRHQAYLGNNGDNESYYTNNINLVNDRILQAGYRLAGMLDQIFKNVPLSSTAVKLRKSISQAIGSDPNFMIDLTPTTTATANIDGVLGRDDCDHDD
jgi:hypothetical protein